jgi:hypothetical protein
MFYLNFPDPSIMEIDGHYAGELGLDPVFEVGDEIRELHYFSFRYVSPVFLLRHAPPLAFTHPVRQLQIAWASCSLLPSFMRPLTHLSYTAGIYPLSTT